VRNNLRQPRITGAHHMGSSVRNLDRSIGFYCDVLGAALVREPYDGDSPSFCGRVAVVGLGKLGLDLFEHAGNKESCSNRPVRVLITLRSRPSRSKNWERGQAGSTHAMFRTRALGKSLVSGRCSISLTQMGFNWSSCLPIGPSYRPSRAAG